MPVSRAGTYTSRALARLSSAATIAMCEACLISENRILVSSIHTRPDAFGSHRCGSPPRTGTTHVSQPFKYVTVYAMREPSAENTGLIFARPSRVSCCGAPSGRILT